MEPRKVPTLRNLKYNLIFQSSSYEKLKANVFEKLKKITVVV